MREPDAISTTMRRECGTQALQTDTSFAGRVEQHPQFMRVATESIPDEVPGRIDLAGAGGRATTPGARKSSNRGRSPSADRRVDDGAAGRHLRHPHEPA